LNAFTSIINNYIYFIHYAPPFFVIMIIFGIIGGSLSKTKSEPKKIKKNIDNRLKHEYVEVPRQNPLIKRAIREKKHRAKDMEEDIPEFI